MSENQPDKPYRTMKVLAKKFGRYFESIKDVNEYVNVLRYSNQEDRMNGKSDLRPCPFCGGEIYITPVKFFGAERAPAHIKCNKCNYFIARFENDELINFWNTRPLEDALQCRLDDALACKQELIKQVVETNKEVDRTRRYRANDAGFRQWVWSVYAKNVIDLILNISNACTYDDEKTAKAGECALPKKLFDDMARLLDYSHSVYDGSWNKNTKIIDEINSTTKTKRTTDLYDGLIESAEK